MPTPLALRPIALGLIGAAAATAALAQQQPGASKAGRPAAAIAQAAPKAKGDAPALVLTAVPANPGDPIAKVNGEVITRGQLADEAIALKGEEILETMIARKLVEQAVRARKIAIGQDEIEQEIDRVASMSGVDREAWLRTLAKERRISPSQYARNVIYPAVGLRKLAEATVVVTPDEVTQAFDANFGERIRCRLIMVDSSRKCQEVWNRLKENPGGFEKLAQEVSIDQATRALGGLVADPIARHAVPLSVSEPAFKQLVDGDPDDKDPSHKPKDGDFTGPIQFNEAAWIILRREKVEPGRPVDRDDPAIKEQMRKLVFGAKLKAAMADTYDALVKAAAIENELTGQVKLAKEEEHPAHQVTDAEVRKARMSKPEEAIPPTPGLPTKAAPPRR